MVKIGENGPKWAKIERFLAIFREKITENLKRGTEGDQTIKLSTFGHPVAMRMFPPTPGASGRSYGHFSNLVMIHRGYP